MNQDKTLSSDSIRSEGKCPGFHRISKTNTVSAARYTSIRTK